MFLVRMITLERIFHHSTITWITQQSMNSKHFPCVCMGYEPDKWILSSHQQNSFLHSFFLKISILLNILLRLLFNILKLGVLDANQVPKPIQDQAMKSKAKIMLDEFVDQWIVGCSFLMGCNCNTARCFRVNYERGKGIRGKVNGYRIVLLYGAGV